MTIESPCIRLCRLDHPRGLCGGCGRSAEEIAGWSAFSPERRREIMALLPARLAGLSATAPGAA